MNPSQRVHRILRHLAGFHPDPGDCSANKVDKLLIYPNRICSGSKLGSYTLANGSSIDVTDVGINIITSLCCVSMFIPYTSMSKIISHSKTSVKHPLLILTSNGTAVCIEGFSERGDKSEMYEFARFLIRCSEDAKKGRSELRGHDPGGR